MFASLPTSSCSTADCHWSFCPAAKRSRTRFSPAAFALRTSCCCSGVNCISLSHVVRGHRFNHIVKPLEDAAQIPTGGSCTERQWVPSRSTDVFILRIADDLLKLFRRDVVLSQVLDDFWRPEPSSSRIRCIDTLW